MEGGQVKVKYPRTFHDPSSPGLQSDDKVASDLSGFANADVVVTEKMDGENTTLYQDGFHARSLDTAYHPSRNWLAAFHASIGYKIPDGWRICGENLYARHSVAYTNLASFFLGFSIWDDQNTCLDWDKTKSRFAQIGVTPVKEIYRGPYSPNLLSDLGDQIDTDKTEGLVMRVTRQFAYADFAKSVIKWVRADHVQPDATHWSKAELIPNTCQPKGAT